MTGDPRAVDWATMLRWETNSPGKSVNLWLGNLLIGSVALGRNFYSRKMEWVIALGSSAKFIDHEIGAEEMAKMVAKDWAVELLRGDGRR